MRVATLAATCPRPSPPSTATPPRGNPREAHPSRAAALVIALLATGACGRDEDSGEDEETTSTTEADGGGEGGDAAALSEGGFGDMEAVCQDGDASGSTATGVTDTEINVGTVTDKGGPVSGLNVEMYDAAVAFTEWCNEHGGILGREIVLHDADAKLQEYEAAMTTACEQDFALVGGGAVFDEDPNGVRVGCGLPNIAGYVVSEPARTADLQVQPIPNPVDKIAIGRHPAAAAAYPDGVDHYGIMTSALPSVILVSDQLEDAATQAGFTIDYRVEYAPLNETGWDNFAREIKDKGVKILEYVGQPADLVLLNEALDTAGYYPDVILLSTNFIDDVYAEEVGRQGRQHLHPVGLPPDEMAEDNKATQDYLDLMEEYNPGGQGRPARRPERVGLAALRQGGHRVRLRPHRRVPAGAGRGPGGLDRRRAPRRADPGQHGARRLLADPDPHRRRVPLQRGGHAPTDGDGLFNCSPENVATAERLMSEFLALTVLGLCTAAVFALAASGLVLTYTTTGIFNFAHGAIGMLGAFAYWQLHDDWGWPTVRGPRRRPAGARARPRPADRARDHAPPHGCAGDGADRGHDQPAWSPCSGSGSGGGRPTRPIPPPCSSRARASRVFGVGVTWHRISAVIVALVGGARAAGPALPHPGRPRHAGVGRQPGPHPAPRRPTRPLRRPGLGDRLLARRPGRDPRRRPRRR